MVRYCREELELYLNSDSIRRSPIGNRITSIAHSAQPPENSPQTKDGINNHPVNQQDSTCYPASYMNY